MYELKIKAARLCRGIRFRCFLLSLAFLAVGLSSLLFFLTGVMCAFYGSENILDGVAAWIGIRPAAGYDAAVSAVSWGIAAFFFVCASSLLFTLKAEFCFAADKNQSRPASFLSWRSGVRYIRYQIRAAVKKTLILLRFLLPFALELASALLFLSLAGVSAVDAVLLACLLILSLAVSLGAAFVWCRQYDAGVYLLYLNPMLSPGDALRSSEEKTAGRLLGLACCKLRMLPKKLSCVLLLPALFAVPLTGVSAALISEKIYGEDKRKVKQPAVTFYINKKTKMELHESAAEG